MPRLAPPALASASRTLTLAVRRLRAANDAMYSAKPGNKRGAWRRAQKIAQKRYYKAQRDWVEANKTL